jgi:hypothetical protein
MMRKLETWPATVGRSLVLGSLVGAACLELLVLFVLVGVIAHPKSGLTMFAGILMAPLIAPLAFLAAFAAWFLGLVVFGLAPWWALHSLKFRSRRDAVVLGFSLPLLFELLWTQGQFFPLGAVLPAAGIGVALTIWYSTYKYGAGAPDVDALNERLDLRQL